MALWGAYLLHLPMDFNNLAQLFSIMSRFFFSLIQSQGHTSKSNIKIQKAILGEEFHFSKITCYLQEVEEDPDMIDSGFDG